MDAITGTACAHCKTPRRETNHWYVVVTNDAGGYWQPFDEFDGAQPGEDVFVVCGQMCFSKVASAWFSRPKDAEVAK